MQRNCWPLKLSASGHEIVTLYASTSCLQTSLSAHCSTHTLSSNFVYRRLLLLWKLAKFAGMQHSTLAQLTRQKLPESWLRPNDIRNLRKKICVNDRLVVVLNQGFELGRLPQLLQVGVAPDFTKLIKSGLEAGIECFESRVNLQWTDIKSKANSTMQISSILMHHKIDKTQRLKCFSVYIMTLVVFTHSVKDYTIVWMMNTSKYLEWLA